MRHPVVPVFALTLVLITVATLPTWAAQAPPDSSQQAVVTVEGMQCPFCAYGIRKHLAKLPGARKVEVELAKNQAIVTFAPDATVGDKDIQRAVRNAGFTAGKIEWRPARQPTATAKPTGER